jgi:hypothetical protein
MEMAQLARVRLVQIELADLDPNDKKYQPWAATRIDRQALCVLTRQLPTAAVAQRDVEWYTQQMAHPLPDWIHEGRPEVSK